MVPLESQVGIICVKMIDPDFVARLKRGDDTFAKDDTLFIQLSKIGDMKVNHYIETVENNTVDNYVSLLTSEPIQLTVKHITIVKSSSVVNYTLRFISSSLNINEDSWCCLTIVVVAKPVDNNPRIVCYGLELFSSRLYIQLHILPDEIMLTRQLNAKDIADNETKFQASRKHCDVMRMIFKKVIEEHLPDEDLINTIAEMLYPYIIRYMKT